MIPNEFSIKRPPNSSNEEYASPTKKSRFDRATTSIAERSFNSRSQEAPSLGRHSLEGLISPPSKTSKGAPSKSKSRIPSREAPTVSSKTPTTLIYLADYCNATGPSIASIPDLGDHTIRRLGKGKNHLVYEFEFKKGQTINLPAASANPYAHFSLEGTFDLSEMVLKIVNPLVDPKSKSKQIAHEKTIFEKEQNPEYRTKIYFYGEDGLTLEQKVAPLPANDQAQFDKALKFAKMLLDKNVKAEETLIFDIRPDNIGFTSSGQPLFLDRDSSPVQDFKFELVKDLGEWVRHENPSESVQKERFDYLTSSFSGELRRFCREELQKAQ